METRQKAGLALTGALMCAVAVGALVEGPGGPSGAPEIAEPEIVKPSPDARAGEPVEVTLPDEEPDFVPDQDSGLSEARLRELRKVGPDGPDVDLREREPLSVERIREIRNRDGGPDLTWGEVGGKPEGFDAERFLAANYPAYAEANPEAARKVEAARSPRPSGDGVADYGPTTGPAPEMADLLREEKREVDEWRRDYRERALEAVPYPDATREAMEESDRAQGDGRLWK